MFGLKLWGRFAAFRDPITITQNITLPIPPKTTIGGMMAAILGIDYNIYFNDEEYFDFKYSLVLPRTIRKKSFTQNYIADYTKESGNKFDIMAKYYKSVDILRELIIDKKQLISENDDSEAFNKKIANIENKIQKAKEDNDKKYQAYMERLYKKFPKPKPIFRELLLNPEYLIFIDNFKYEQKLIEYLQSHKSEYNLYFGNTEFAANYEYWECETSKIISNKLNSFTTHSDLIVFEAGKKYTPIYAATKTVADRTYRDYKKIILSDSEINLKSNIGGYNIKTKFGEYNCEFI
jgi:CRISPR-associated protein Cas5h